MKTFCKYVEFCIKPRNHEGHGSTFLLEAGEGWRVVSDGWRVAGDRWQLKKYDNLIKLVFATRRFSLPEMFRKLPNISVDIRNVPMKGIFSWFLVPKIQF